MRGLALSATASVALLALTNIADASLVLSGHENSDQPYKVAEAAPEAPQQQAALQQDPQGPTEEAAHESSDTPDSNADEDKTQQNDRKVRSERRHREDLGHLAHRKIKGWLHRFRVGRRW
jgi:hypothetical protein